MRTWGGGAYGQEEGERGDGKGMEGRKSDNQNWSGDFLQSVKVDAIIQVL